MRDKLRGSSRSVSSVILAAAALVSCVTDPPATPADELKLTILPQTVTVSPGEQVVFDVLTEAPEGSSARVLLKTSLGASYTGDEAGGVSWSATGGIIDRDGRYAASQLPGQYLVIATVSTGAMADTGHVIVTEAALTPVASVSVTPTSTTTEPGGVIQLIAELRAADGEVLTGRAVTWSSDNPSVADVSGSGRVTAHDAGAATITALSGGVSGSASVAVSDVPVVSVSISPSSATLEEGESVQFSALLQDPNGNTLTGRSVGWSSDDVSVATIDDAGVATALGPGTATITASSGTASDAASVSVAEGVYSPVNECATPQASWIWCDDFEQDRLASYFEYDDRGGAFVRTSNVGVNGSQGMRAHWNAGDISAGNLKLAFGSTPDSYFRPADDGVAKYRDLYWRLFVKHEDGWLGGGAGKLSRVTVFGSGAWAQAMIAHVWSGGKDDLVIDPASGTDEQGNLRTTQYNDFANLRWLGSAASATRIFDQAHVGQWYCVEAHVRLNDAGQTNGVFQLWINDDLEAERSGLNWVGAYDDYGINAVFVENHWNEGSPSGQERYFDNLVVGTERIGCDIVVSPPDDTPVASVVVSPSSISVAEGTTAQLVAELRDAAGATLYGLPVTWSSSNSVVATVSATGVVTGLAPGGTEIAASSGGKSGVANVTVPTSGEPPPPPNGGAHPNEPAGYAAFAEHSFAALPNWPGTTSGTGLVSGWWWDYPTGNTFAVNDPSAPASGPATIDVRFPTTLAGGSAPVNFGGWDAGGESVGKRKIYHSMWFKLVGQVIPNHNVLIKWGFLGLSPGGNQIFWSLPGEGRGHNTSVTDFSIRIDRQGSPVRFETQKLNTATRVRVGQWHHLESVIELGDPGQSNGVFRVWLDGVPIHNWTNWEFGSSALGGWKFNPTWGGGGSSPSPEWHVRIDHIYMSGVN